MAARNVVIAGTPSAGQAGAHILANGGNAVDAAVATTLALAVTDPANVSLGGRLHAVVAQPDGATEVIDGATQVPQLRPRQGPVPLPGLPAALELMHDRQGRLAPAQVIEPARKLAAEGFAVSAELSRIWRRHAQALALDPGARQHLLSAGAAPARHEQFCQPALAALLGDLACHGLGSFYRHNAVERDGPWSPQDLRSYRAELGSEQRMGLGGPQLVTTGKQAWGPVLCRLMERFMQEPPDEYEVTQIDRIAHWCQDVLRPEVPAGRWWSSDQDTSHLAVIDQEGRAVSLTASIGPHFGVRRAHPTCGFAYALSYRMVNGAPVGWRDVTEMCPTVLIEHNRPRLAIGGAGSERIPLAVGQVLRRHLQDQADIVGAVAAPRIAAMNGRLRLWHGADVALVTALERLGWQVERAGPGHIDHVGLVHAASRLEGGEVVGAADQHYDGVAVTLGVV